MISIAYGGWTVLPNAGTGLPDAVRDVGVLIDGDTIAAIEPLDRLRQRFPEAPLVGSGDYLLMPGMVNAHHHVGLTPTQLGSPDLPLELWWASRIAARSVDPRLDTLYSAMEMVESGVTTVQHLHGRVGGPLQNLLSAADTVVDAYRTVGMRVSYSMGFRDQNSLVYEDDELFFARLPQGLGDRLREFYASQKVDMELHETFLREMLDRHGGDKHVRTQIAPTNLHWCSDAALERLAWLSDTLDLPMHMHLDETAFQREYAHRRTGGSAIAYLDRKGMLNPRMTIGHAVWADQEDIGRIARSGAHICCNCSSNLRLRSGIAPLNAFMHAGIGIALGIDEAGINDDRDMFQEMRVALRVNRVPGMDDRPPAPAAVLKMATESGAATTPFGATIGSIEQGRAADLVFIDWRQLCQPYLDARTPPVDAVVLRARPSHVRCVMVAGQEIYRDGKFAGIDKQCVIEELATRMRADPTSAERDRADLAREIMPHVARFYADYRRGPPPNPHYVFNGTDQPT